MRDYHINIFYSEEDQGYVADIPDLNACSAFGETPDSCTTWQEPSLLGQYSSSSCYSASKFDQVYLIYYN